ncbi:MAG TPA: LLM class flavin-dependent oxidoreductase, partial [Stellaceae bacterium]|nr:LLM class flavin-dependent oxidoreductase [Stellaceae bacterium]
MSIQPPRFGIWSLVYGTWASMHHPEDPPDASWERNKRLVREAEALGFDSTLVAQHIVNPFGEQYDQLETWTASAALAAVTDKIEIIAAIKPYLIHPVVLAKQALQIEEISRGRFAINLVNAWFKPEFEKAGIVFADHDERYAYGSEWLAVVRELMSGRRVDFKGKYFTVDGYQLKPKDRFRERPTIYVGGESDAARGLVADAADVWFINGQPVPDVQRLIADVASRPRSGPPVRFGLAAFVIARETDEAAQ